MQAGAYSCSGVHSKSRRDLCQTCKHFYTLEKDSSREWDFPEIRKHFYRHFYKFSTML